jgi:hypothetical protein
MIKSELKLTDSRSVVYVAATEVQPWMEETFGKKENGKRRQWSVRADYHNRKIIIMTRIPEQAVIVRLRWGSI